MKRKLPILSLLVFSLVFAWFCEPITWLREWFDPMLRLGNPGRFEFQHPLSLLFGVTPILLPIALFVAMFGCRIASRTAMVLSAYPLFYILYGTYVVKPAAFVPGRGVLFVMIVGTIVWLWVLFRNSPTKLKISQQDGSDKRATAPRRPYC